MKQNKTSYYFTTQGDANDAPDGSPVYYKNVIGTPVFSIPYLGYLSSWLQTKKGMIMGISIALVILILTFLPDLIDRIMGEGDAKPPGEQTCAQDTAFEGACEKPCCPDQESAPNAEDDGRPPPE